MIRWVVAGSIKFRLIVLTIAAAILVAGPIQLSRAPVEALPEFMPPYVEIQTEALGLSSTEVEQLISVPLEADLLNGVQGVSVIRSQSVAGLSSIVMVFEPGTDPYLARALVQERLTQAHALPQVSKPPTMLQPLSSSSRFLMISLESQQLTPVERSVLARWTVRPRLMGIPGVANVAVWGQRERQLQVQVDPQRLRDAGVTLQQVVTTTGNAQIVSPLSFLEASTPGTGGFVETAQQRLQVRHVFDALASPAELGRVPVDGTEGRLRLADVATVTEDHQPLIGDAIVGGKGEGLLLVVEKFPGANTVDVTKSVEDALDALRPGLTTMTMDTSLFRPAGYVNDALSNLALAGIVAGLLLIVGLVAWFLRWRTVVVAVVAILSSLTAAALVLDARGASFNALALAGLMAAVALVVDDAVGGATAVGGWRTSSRRSPSTGEAAARIDAYARTRSPLGYAVLIGLLLVVPVLAAEGRPGEFFRPVAVSYALAMLASFVVALTLVPALGSVLLSAKPARREPASMRRLGTAYARGLSGVLARPRFAVAAVGLAAAIAVVGGALTQATLIPTFQDRDVLVTLEGPAGTSLPAMTAAVSQTSQQLSALPGVETVGAHVGRAVTGDQVVDVNSSELWVHIRADADYQQTMAAIGQVVAGVSGFGHDVVTYSGQRLRDAGALDQNTEVRSSDLEVLTGSAHPVVVRVYGEDMAVLQAKAQEIRSKVAAVTGIVNPQVQESAMQDEIQIEVDLDKARQHGIKPGDVRRAEAILLQGIQVGSIFEGQKVFDVVVQGTPSTRQSIDSVNNLLIDTPAGGSVRLAEVATVRMGKVPTSIDRDAVARRVDVTADVSGIGVGAAADAVRAAIAGTTFPLEHHAEVFTSSADQEVNAARVLVIAIGALIAIFLLVQAAFRSWRLAGLSLLALPAALSGGVVVALFAGLSLGAVLGLLAVLGVAVRHTVLFVGEAQRIDSDTAGEHRSAARDAAAARLPAVIGSTIGIAALALPAVFLGQRPGLEIISPMALVLLGGLVTSTLLGVFLLPALYRRARTPDDAEPRESVPAPEQEVVR